jgi:3-deoxy-D-manno-octulosonic-acid transferase
MSGFLRFVYNLTLYLMMPWVWWRMWRRGARVPAYRQHWRERFGLPHLAQKDVVWIHAVSVGEVRAARPLVEQLQRRWPQRAFLVTTTTPAGRETVRQVFGPRMACAYLPWDLPGAVRRFLARVSPAVAIVMETEIWPNLYRALSQRGVPLLLVNARLSDASLRGYKTLRGLARRTLRCVDRIAAQTPADAEAFLALGADPQRLSVAGNLKLNASLPDGFERHSAEWRERLGLSRRIWIAGSTHPGEEAQVIAAHRQVLSACPDALLILAPRHPERARDVAQLCEDAGMAWACFSAARTGGFDAPLLILDVLGELAVLYGAADVAFIGGSLVDRGGHNPVEAVLADVPLISGPSTGNFAFIYGELAARDAMRSVDSAAALAQAVIAWFGDAQQRQSTAAAARQVVARHRGAVQRIVALVEKIFSAARRGAWPWRDPCPRAGAG